MAAPPETTYAVLGLIDKVPLSSGYELVAVADRSFAHFWPISHTLMYRELSRLVDLGWVVARRVDQTHAPSKSIYEVTDEGRRVLAEWLDAPTPAGSTYRSGFMLKFFFAQRMRPDQVRALLAEYRAALEAQRDELQAVADKLEPLAHARMARLSALHGLRTATARLAWVDEVAATLEAEPG